MLRTTRRRRAAAAAPPWRRAAPRPRASGCWCCRRRSKSRSRRQRRGRAARRGDQRGAGVLSCKHTWVQRSAQHSTAQHTAQGAARSCTGAGCWRHTRLRHSRGQRRRWAKQAAGAGVARGAAWRAAAARARCSPLRTPCPAAPLPRCPLQIVPLCPPCGKASCCRPPRPRLGAPRGRPRPRRSNRRPPAAPVARPQSRGGSPAFWLAAGRGRASLADGWRRGGRAVAHARRCAARAEVCAAARGVHLLLCTRGCCCDRAPALENTTGGGPGAGGGKGAGGGRPSRRFTSRPRVLAVPMQPTFLSARAALPNSALAGVDYKCVFGAGLGSHCVCTR